MNNKIWTKVWGQHEGSVYLLCALLFVLFFIVDLMIPLGVAAGVPYVSVVLVSLWVPNKSFTLKVALLSSVLTLFGLLYSPLGGEMWKVLMNRGLALFAIWATAVLTLQRKGIGSRLNLLLKPIQT